MRAILPPSITAATLLLSSLALSAEDSGPGVSLTLDSGTLSSAYALYWGGFHIGNLESHLRIGAANYDLEMHYRTEGMLAWFVDGKSRLAASGARTDTGALMPQGYLSHSIWDENERRIEAAYDATGKMRIAVRAPEDDGQREPVPPSLQDGYDPLSALVAVAMDPAMGPADPEKDGHHVIRTYDGKRAMRYSWRCGEMEALEPNGPSVFSGEALRCEATGRQLAGFHRKYRDRNLVLERPATLWLAAVDGSPVMMPVRMMMETQYGALMAHVVRVGPPTVEDNTPQN